jgi:hypothetical protein
VTPEAVVQRQFEAANAHDIERFIAEFADDAQIFAPPAVAPALVGKAAIAHHYSTKRFNIPALRYDLLNRMVTGNIMVDHERITGIEPEPYEVMLVYQIMNGRVQAVWLFRSSR